MQIQTTCRHTKMTPTLKRFLEQRLAKLERFADVREAHVILASQKYVQTAEVLLKTRKKELVVREESHDLVLSVD
ncbi:MAG: HPF/RaiA family ribosome-associated protein, partial [Candidatus Eiseniibacteriota bacterium]